MLTKLLREAETYISTPGIVSHEDRVNLRNLINGTMESVCETFADERFMEKLKERLFDK